MFKAPIPLEDEQSISAPSLSESIDEEDSSFHDSSDHDIPLPASRSRLRNDGAASRGGISDDESDWQPAGSDDNEVEPLPQPNNTTFDRNDNMNSDDVAEEGAAQKTTSLKRR